MRDKKNILNKLINNTGYSGTYSHNKLRYRKMLTHKYKSIRS